MLPGTKSSHDSYLIIWGRVKVRFPDLLEECFVRPLFSLAFCAQGI